jgi:hypothetical protein
VYFFFFNIIIHFSQNRDQNILFIVPFRLKTFNLFFAKYQLKMLKILLLLLAITTCIDSQARDIIDSAKEAAKIAKKLQPGNICLENDDCYPINVFNNLCCMEYTVVGQCCNMFSYIAEQP